MIRTFLFILLSLIIVFTFSSCQASAYSFKESVDEIDTIEIVSAENSLEYTVLKTLSETERDNFLKQFKTIKFHRYIAGDPMSVSGNAVKITYRNENYEIICFYWAEYVNNGEVFYVWKNCDEDAFNRLLESFLKEESKK